MNNLTLLAASAARRPLLARFARPFRAHLAAGLLAGAALAGLLPAQTWIVAPSGGDFTTIQDALDVAVAGELILVKDKPGGYGEKIDFPRSGNPTAGPIVLRAYPGHSPAIDGAGVAGSDMVTISDRSYVTLDGFEIRNNLGVNDGSGVRIIGAGTQIVICNNRIHDVRGVDAMGITVYGTSVTASISDLVIEGNEIYQCDPARSEALTLNGNVERFAVVGNIVRDVNNIGIDFIGGETDINPQFGCRNGVCRGNYVARSRSNYGGGFGAGIYVDGGSDILIEANIVTECDLGIEIGAENPGTVTSDIIVRDNIVFANDKVGIVFGGYEQSVGRVQRCSFTNNLCYANDTLAQGLGEIWIQWASDNHVRNNIFVSTAQNQLLRSGPGGQNNRFDYNLWHTMGTPGSAIFTWQDTDLFGFAAYRQQSGQGANSQFTDPLLSDPAQGDFSLLPTSPAIDVGDPAELDARPDAVGSPRVQDGNLDLDMRIDQGPHEFANVRLRVGGDLVASGTLSVSVDGTATLQSAVVIAFEEGAFALPPFGAFFVSPSSPWIVLPTGAIPATRSIPLPASLPSDARAFFQALCINAVSGNTSNLVEK